MLILFGTMVVLMLLGMPIFFAMGMGTVAYLVSTAGEVGATPLIVIPQKMMNGVDSFVLLAIPMFMLAGEIMNRGGVTMRLINFSKMLVGHLPGGLAQVVIVVNVIMAGMSGSSVADASATGSVLIPAMTKAKYPAPFAAGLVAAASTVGPVIPPSIPMVVIGGVVGVSVGQLFLGGAIPGFLMALSMMIVVHILAKRRGYERSPRATLRDILRESWQALLALLVPVVVLGSIITGVATPTEAAGIAVAYGFLLSVFVYREMSLRDAPEILLEVAITTATIAVTIGVAKLMGWVASAAQAGEALQALIFSISTSPVVILAMINVFLLIMGCLMEIIPIIILTSPILFPIIDDLGIDPIHFGVMMTVNLMIGLVTPPVGMTLFVTSTISRVPMLKVFWSAAPFLLAILIVLIAITYYPPLVTWLPTAVMSGR